MTYNTAIAPNETKTGYYILTATNGTMPNATTTKGYALFYEGNSINSTTSRMPEITPTVSGTLAQTSLPPAVGPIFGSFELLAAPGVGPTAPTFGQSFPITNTTGTNATGITGTAETAEGTGGGGGDNGGGDEGVASGGGDEGGGSGGGDEGGG